jgi:hypothetical protein
MIKLIVNRYNYLSLNAKTARRSNGDQKNMILSGYRIPSTKAIYIPLIQISTYSVESSQDIKTREN